MPIAQDTPGIRRRSRSIPRKTRGNRWLASHRCRSTRRSKSRAGLRATFRHAGHILGAATVLLEIDGEHERRILFSGDLGRTSHPLLLPPEAPPACDAIVVESTYGDRIHDDAQSIHLFDEAIARTAARGGIVIVPAFAVDRTEIILFHLRRLIRQGTVPAMPVYVDSPMALAALRLYKDAIVRTVRRSGRRRAASPNCSIRDG